MAELRRTITLLAYGAEVFLDYNMDETSCGGVDEEDKALPLDEISPSLVGGLKISKLLKFLDPLAHGRGKAPVAQKICSSMKWYVLLTILLLLDPSDNIKFAPPWVKPFSDRCVIIPKKRIGLRYATHVSQLTALPPPGTRGSPLLRAVQEGTSWFISGYLP
jgi:hypothetical protein